MKRSTLFLSTLLASVAMSSTAFAGEGKSFSDLDKDGDGNLSQQELQDAGKDVQVSEYDTDNDGVLSEEEYKQAKEQMKEKK